MKKLLHQATGRNTRIVVIDSGINKEHSLLKDANIMKGSIAIHESGNDIWIDHNIDDKFGHGTAVCGILRKLIPDAEIFIVKIFDELSLRADETKLIFALEYIYKNVHCDIIHLSLGIIIPSSRLHELCKHEI